jgi:ADP-ribose pyrophosphatase
MTAARRQTDGTMTNALRTLLETRRFRVVEETVAREDGRTASLQYVVHPGSVAILPLVDDDHVCLIRNRRLTVQATIVEIPAGTREPNEPPLDCARRELEEETGYRAARWDKLIEFYASPGILSERMHVFLARDLTPGDPRREANEEIENLVVTWAEALAMLDRGEIVDGKTIVALLMWERMKKGAGS